MSSIVPFTPGGPRPTLLFLFNTSAKCLHGVFVATCAPRMSIDPAAYRGRFPSQVLVRRVACPERLYDRVDVSCGPLTAELTTRVCTDFGVSYAEVRCNS